MDRLAKVGPKAAAAAREAKPARPDGLSVGEVAQRLGVTKAEVRATLQRPEFAARTQPRAATNGAAPEVARGVIVPEDLLADLREALAARPSEAAAQEPPPGGERGTYPNPPGPEMSLAIVYERLLSEKDARIADLRAEIDHLRGVLEREQSGHARTQTLLSLQAPESPAEPTTAESPAAKAEQIVQAAAKRPVWQFWRRD